MQKPFIPDRNEQTLSTLASAIVDNQLWPAGSSEDRISPMIEEAKHHGVIPLLNLQVHDDPVHRIPDNSRKELSDLAKNLAIQDMMLNSATRNTINLLSASNIPALLLKGTPIAFLYYPETYLRPRCDTDILIREEDVKRSSAILKDNEYNISGLEEIKHSSKQYSATFTTSHNLYQFFDMHWKLSNRVIFNNALQFNECWEMRQPVTGLGENAYTLSAPHLLLHACIHRIAHGRNSERNRLIWLYDIHLLASAFSVEEFSRFLQLALKKKMGALCHDGLVASQRYFNTEYPSDYLSELEENRKNEPSARLVHASKLQWAFADMLAMKTFKEKLAFSRELLFPADTTGEMNWLTRFQAWGRRLIFKIR